MTRDIDPTITLRLSYSDGMFLTVGGMQTEQKYYDSLTSYQTGYLYEAGVLEGLKVNKTSNAAITVASGSGIDGYGRFLVQPEKEKTLPLDISAVGKQYVSLVYPTSKTAIKDSPDIIDVRANIVIASSASSEGILLAEINVTAVDAGMAAEVKDLRKPVVPRVMPDMQSAAGQSGYGPVLRGRKQVEVTGSVSTGFYAEASVTFIPDAPEGSPPPFESPPVVTATAEYSSVCFLSLKSVSNTGFDLILCVPPESELKEMGVAVANASSTISVNWMACAQPT